MNITDTPIFNNVRLFYVILIFDLTVFNLIYQFRNLLYDGIREPSQRLRRLASVINKIKISRYRSFRSLKSRKFEAFLPEHRVHKQRTEVATEISRVSRKRGRGAVPPVYA